MATDKVQSTKLSGQQLYR